MCSLERTPSSADTFAERHTSTPLNRGKAGWCHCRHHTHLPTACRGCIGTGAAQARFCERKSEMPAQPPLLLQSLRKLLPAHMFKGRPTLHLPHRSQPAQSASCSTRRVRAFQAIRQRRCTPQHEGLGPDPSEPDPMAELRSDTPPKPAGSDKVYTRQYPRSPIDALHQDHQPKWHNWQAQLHLRKDQSGSKASR